MILIATIPLLINKKHDYGKESNAAKENRPR